jgi:hypothetical protein
MPLSSGLFLGGGRQGRNKILTALPQAVALQCQTLTAVFGGAPVSAGNPLLCGYHTGRSKTVTFNIPAGSWSLCTWEKAGTSVAGSATNGNDTITTAPSSAAILLPNYALGGSFDQTQQASGQQVADINSAAGSTLSVTVNFTSDNPGFGDETINLFTLTVCKPVQVIPVPMKFLPIKNQPFVDLPKRPNVYLVKFPPKGGAGPGGAARKGGIQQLGLGVTRIL